MNKKNNTNQKKKKILNLTKSIYIIFFSSISYLYAHGGGLNSEGCHNENKTGGYHCHRDTSLINEIISMQKKTNTSETSINNRWCESKGGITEFRTKDGTFVDCLTDLYAVEAEFENKWKEAIGQSLHYAESTNREAAILLIKKQDSNKDYHAELKRVVNKYNLPITVFFINQ